MAPVRADLYFSLQGALKNVAKRRNLIRNEKVFCRNQLTIRFDQLEDGTVNYYVLPDQKIYATRDLSLMDMAEQRAPLSSLGIRALWKMCADGLVFTALETASAFRDGVEQRIAASDDVSEAQDSSGEIVLH